MTVISERKFGIISERDFKIIIDDNQISSLTEPYTMLDHLLLRLALRETTTLPQRWDL